jgi:DNA-binding transcriptional regulator YiaG
VSEALSKEEKSICYRFHISEAQYLAQKSREQAEAAERARQVPLKTIERIRQGAGVSEAAFAEAEDREQARKNGK